MKLIENCGNAKVYEFEPRNSRIPYSSTKHHQTITFDKHGYKLVLICHLSWVTETSRHTRLCYVLQPTETLLYCWLKLHVLSQFLQYAGNHTKISNFSFSCTGYGRRMILFSHQSVWHDVSKPWDCMKRHSTQESIISLHRYKARPGVIQQGARS